MARMAMIGYARMSTTDQNPEAQAARQYDRSAITVDAAYQAATRSVTATAAIVMARRQCGSRAAMMRVATAAASSAHSPIPPAHTQACAVAHGVHAPELQLYLPVQSDPMRERLRNIRRDQPTDAPPDSMTQITLIADARPMQPGRLPSGFVMRAPETGDTEQLGQLYFDSHVPGSDHKFAADAIQEVSLFFRGEFGDFRADASGHRSKVPASRPGAWAAQQMPESGSQDRPTERGTSRRHGQYAGRPPLPSYGFQAVPPRPMNVITSIL